MNNKLKKSIIGLILTGTIGGGVLTGGGITILNLPEGNKWLTNNQYEEVKGEMIFKYWREEEFTIQEYQLFVAVLDKETKRKGKLKIKNVNQGNLVDKIINEVVIR